MEQPRIKSILAQLQGKLSNKMCWQQMGLVPEAAQESQAQSEASESVT